MDRHGRRAGPGGGGSFVQQERFLAGPAARTVATVIRLPSEMGPGGGSRGTQHLSAVVIWGISKHVLESIGLSEQQADLLVAPVDRREVL